MYLLVNVCAVRLFVAHTAKTAENGGFRYLPFFGESKKKKKKICYEK